MSDELSQSQSISPRASCSQCLRSLESTNAYRCSRCQRAYYCNKECQRSHWNRGHKLHCRAISALKELNGLMTDMTEQSTQESFHTSMDVVAAIQNMKTPESLDDPWVSKILSNSTSNPPQDSTSIHMTRSSTQHTEFPPSTIAFDTYRCLMKSHRRRCHSKRQVATARKRTPDLNTLLVHVYVEHLLRLFTYNIRICIPQSTDFIHLCHKDDVLVALTEHGSKTQVTVQNRTPKPCSSQERFDTMASFLLPIRMVYSKELNDTVTSSVCIQGSSYPSQIDISFRVSYNDRNTHQRLTENDLTEKAMTETRENRNEKLKALNQLECRSCGLGIVEKNSNLPTLHNVLPLPEGHWDEITDYISCFDTSTINFATSSLQAKEGYIFDDSSFFWLHRKDTVNVSILAVDGYGYGENNEAMKDQKSPMDVPERGRPNDGWKDTIDGATICCNQCCDVLGYASLGDTDAYRLLKHKLSAPKGYDNEDQDYLECFTCSSFIARELVRYAETYGIFSFVIKKNGEDDELHDSCILLNVVSWNTDMSHTLQSHNEPKPTTDIEFKRVVKIIFEQTTNWKDQGPSQMKWGSVDFCCSPFNSIDSISWKENPPRDTGIGSYARIFLSHIEWQELHETLIEGKSYFDEMISYATVRLRLGTDSNKASLTLLELH